VGRPILRHLIGAHIAGHNAGEMLNELTLAMNNDLPIAL
jgi:pyruvate/2-oxoglutarate dehydrogenase complex dihydrolipoamide dehydrogenase (E3) component